MDGTYYIGSTQNLEERLQRHNQGRSKYTKNKRPWELVYYEQFEDRPTAVRRESQIKGRKSKEFIETLVRSSRL